LHEVRDQTELEELEGLCQWRIDSVFLCD